MFQISVENSYMNDNSKFLKEVEDKNVYNYIDYDRNQEQVNDIDKNNFYSIHNKHEMDLNNFNHENQNPAYQNEEINQLEKLIDENSIIAPDNNSAQNIRIENETSQRENKVIKQVDRYLKIRDKDIESFKDKWQYEQLNEKLKKERLKRNEMKSLNSSNISEALLDENTLKKKIPPEEKYELIKNEFLRLKSILLPDKMFRLKLFNYIADGDKVVTAFFKEIYYLTLDHKDMKRKLYHKYDIRIVENINYILLLKKINRMISKYDPLDVEFNTYIYGIYD